MFWRHSSDDDLSPQNQKTVFLGCQWQFLCDPPGHYWFYFDAVNAGRYPLRKQGSRASAYREIDRYGQLDMIFEVISSHAEIDPLGKVSYFETTIQRVEVQHNDSTSI